VLGLVVGAVIGYIFWPRKITTCIEIPYVTAQLNQLGALARPNGITVTLRVPIEIASANMWGLTVDTIYMAAYRDGTRTNALCSGEIIGFHLLPQATTRLNITLSSEGTLSAQNGGEAARWLANKCGTWLADGDRSWRLDLYTEFSVYGVTLAFWIEDLELPCLNRAKAIPPQEGGNAAPPPPPPPPIRARTRRRREGWDPLYGVWHDNKYCYPALCALDDLLCDRERCPSDDESLPPPDRVARTL